MEHYDYISSDGSSPYGNLDPNKKVSPQAGLDETLSCIRLAYHQLADFSMGDEFLFDTLVHDQNIPEILNHIRAYHLTLTLLTPVPTKSGTELHRLMFKATREGRACWLN